MIKVHKFKISRAWFFTTVLMFAPFLSLYATGMASVSWFDLTLVLMGGIFLVTTEKISINMYLLEYATLIITQFVIVNVIKDFATMDIILRMLRYFFYIAVMALLSAQYFDPYFGEKLYSSISLFSSVFLWFQLAVLKIWNVYIPGFFTNLPLMRIEMLWHATNYEDRFILGPRPRSIFSEPQIYATFIAGYVAILLSKGRLSKKEKILLVFLNFSVLASLSSTGIVALAAVWFFYFAMECKKGKCSKVIIICLFLVGVAITLLPVLYNSRLIFTSYAITGRLSGYESILLNRDGVFYSLFGHGMVNLDATGIGFLPSVLRTYYYYGILGLLFLVCFFIKLYKCASCRYKLLVLLNAVLLFGTVDFFGIMIFVSMPFIIAHNNSIKAQIGSGFA